MDTIGSRIKLVRLELGMTQTALAKAADVHQSSVSGIEGDKLTNTFALSEIAKALGVYETWLKSGKGPKYTNPITDRLLSIAPTLSVEVQQQLLNLADMLDKSQHH